MRMLWKCMVSASSHCEIYWLRSLTQHLLNAIIYSAGYGRPWITGIGVRSNSIESTTQTSKNLPWALWVFDVHFRRCCISAHFADGLPPAVTGGREHEHRRLHAAWFSRESTTATLCCTALHPAPFRNSSESRTTRRISCYKRLDGQTSIHCFECCTGCLLNSASTTSWPCLRSRLSRRHLRSIWANTSRCTPAHATLDRFLSHCSACHFDGHHLQDDRSALPHLWVGTHCHLLC